jgi:hypothetical protein
VAAGKIDSEAALTAATMFTAAIICGVSAYYGATGHIDNAGSPGGIVDRTFYLLLHLTARD